MKEKIPMFRNILRLLFLVAIFFVIPRKHNVLKAQSVEDLYALLEKNADNHGYIKMLTRSIDDLTTILKESVEQTNDRNMQKKLNEERQLFYSAGEMIISAGIMAALCYICYKINEENQRTPLQRFGQAIVDPINQMGRRIGFI